MTPGSLCVKYIPICILWQGMTLLQPPIHCACSPRHFHSYLRALGALDSVPEASVSKFHGLELGGRVQGSRWSRSSIIIRSSSIRRCSSAYSYQIFFSQSYAPAARNSWAGVSLLNNLRHQTKRMVTSHWHQVPASERRCAGVDQKLEEPPSPPSPAS